MRKLSICAGVLLALGVGAFAQEDADFQKWMKATASEIGVLRKMENKTGADAAASAEKIAVNYDHMKAFWDKRQASDAAKLSEEGKSAALELVSAAKAGDNEKAGAAFRAIGGTCKGCHDVHREKMADGSYKIK